MHAKVPAVHAVQVVRRGLRGALRAANAFASLGTADASDSGQAPRCAGTEGVMLPVIAGLLLLGIAEPSPPLPPPDPAGPVLSVVDAWDAVAAGTAILIDVREERETAEGMASPALWMPTSRIESDPARWRSFLSSLPKGRTLIFYCAKGSRARRAALSAADLGYVTARMEPFGEWLRAGLPVRIPARRS